MYLGETFYMSRLAKTGETFDEGDVEVYAYGFEMFWENVLALGFIQISGIIIGLGLETMFFLLAFLSMRRCAGGFHASTSGRCFLSSLLIYAIFLLLLFVIPQWIVGYVAMICVGASIAPILKLAPFRDKGTPLGPNLTKKFRKMSRIILVIQAVVITGLSALVIASSFMGFSIADIITSATLSMALGLFTSAFALVLAKLAKQGI